jgi:hypothetical protein
LFGKILRFNSIPGKASINVIVMPNKGKNINAASNPNFTHSKTDGIARIHETAVTITYTDPLLFLSTNLYSFFI